MSQTTIDHTPPDADQAEFDADMAYLQSLVDAIENQLTPESAHDIVDGFDQSIVCHDGADAGILLAADWPHDQAADMLAGWSGWPAYVYCSGPDRSTLPVAEEPRARWLTARRVFGILAATAVLVGCAIGWAARADAAPGVGCETIRWGFLGSQLRTVCDTQRRPDGSWTRAREVWVPAGWVRGYCSFGYFSSCSQGYYRERGTVAYEEYLVTDDTVLPDEPGWLPTGSVVIR